MAQIFQINIRRGIILFYILNPAEVSNSYECPLSFINNIHLTIMKLLNIKTFLYHSWGFSLRGRVIFYATSAKALLQITPLLHEIIVGSMLGDLTAERPNSNRNTRLIFKQSAAHKDYIDHLFSLFTLYCGSKPIGLSRFDSRPNRMKTYKSIKFQTFSLPSFNIYKELFYNADGVKIVPSNIKDLLTA